MHGVVPDEGEAAMAAVSMFSDEGMQVLVGAEGLQRAGRRGQ